MAHTGPIGSLQTPPPSLAEPTVEPAQDTSPKGPYGDAEEADRPTSAEQNATRPAALAAIHHITKPLLPPLILPQWWIWKLLGG